MPRSPLIFILCVAACAHLRLPAESAKGPLRYSFTASGRFVTAALDAAGQPVAVPEGFASSALALRGELSREEARQMRDGSLGHLVRFGVVESAEIPTGPWTPSTLGGRSVELRTFDNGEILDIYEAGHLAGAPRHGEVFDVLFLALSPVIPEVQPGESAWRRGSWPFYLSPERGLRSTFTTNFTNEGTVDSAHGPTLRLPYSGTFEGRGQDLRYDATLVASGSLDGTVWLRATDVEVVRHELRCTRALTARFESGAQLTQTQRLDVVIDRLEAP